MNNTGDLTLALTLTSLRLVRADLKVVKDRVVLYEIPRQGPDGILEGRRVTAGLRLK